MPGATAIIVNYNSSKRTPIIAESLKAALELDYSPLETIVIDNGSTDDSDKVLQELVEQYSRKGANAKFFKLHSNLGFGAANNFGLSHASSSSKYIALINSDLAPQRKSLRSLVSYLETHREVGGVQGKILTWDGSRIDNAGVYLSPAWYVFPRGIMMPAETEYHEASVSYIDGAYSVYSIRAISKAEGLFVEDFFLYGDDFELGARLWRSGFALKYRNVEAGKHYRGLTLKQLGEKLTYFRWRGQTGTIVAHERNWIPIILLRLPLVLRSTPTYAKYAIRGTLDGLSLGLRLRRRFRFPSWKTGPRVNISILKLWAMMAKSAVIGRKLPPERREMILQRDLAQFISTNKSELF
jgi:GT2 family glycosyltransferase